MSGDPHLAGPILVGGFTWAPSKSTHLSPRFFYRVNHSHLLSFFSSSHDQNKTQRLHLVITTGWINVLTHTHSRTKKKKAHKTAAIFRVFIFIINSRDNALVHMTLCHITLSNNTKKYIKGMKGLVHCNIDRWTTTRARMEALCNVMDKGIFFISSTMLERFCFFFFLNDTVVDIQYICDNKYVQNAKKTKLIFPAFFFFFSSSFTL